MGAPDVLIRLQTEDQTPLLVRVSLPARVGRRSDAEITLTDPMVSGLHAVIERVADTVQVRDLDSANGLWRGDERVELAPLTSGPTLRIGHTTLSLGNQAETATPASPTAWVTDLGFTSSGEVTRTQDKPAQSADFPPPCFMSRQVDLKDLEATGLPILESRFLALGGGLGSFCWIDALRVQGTPTADIRVVGFEPVPYARYQRLCRNSQIPDHERLRSNSESTPDNYWGFPGYGAREAWSEMRGLRPVAALQILWQLFAEPDLSPTYTPRAGDVFAAIDREAQRIGWTEMLDVGRIRSIRQTTDGRYAVAVSSRAESDSPRAVHVSPTVHVALGYPGLQFLPDLREYRERMRDFSRVVNAYEEHDELYQTLERDGGTVVLRGRGIVASRVLQRLYEARKSGADIQVIHLMRSENNHGQEAGLARRRVANHWEFQPFNWPEACWGGDLRLDLERASPQERQALIRQWGGTTTADRTDWKRIVTQGIRQGWYRIVFGSVANLEDEGGSLRLTIHTLEDQVSSFLADHVLDATGLVSDTRANPVLADLADTYELPLNPAGRLDVDVRFELTDLRNKAGRVFVAGVSALGGPYAPVDSFLGLQYAAAASLQALAPRVRSMGPLRSFNAWVRWARGARP